MLWHPSWVKIFPENAYFSLLTHTRQLLLVTFTTAGIAASFWIFAQGDRTTLARTDGQTELEVKIVIEIPYSRHY